MVESGAIPVLKRQLIIGTNSTAWQQLLVEEKSSCFFVILPDWPYNEDLYCKTGQERENHYSCHKPSSTTFTLLQPTKKPIWESSTHKPERKSIIPRKCVGFFPQKKVLIQSLRPSLALAACASKVCAGNLWKLHSGCTDRVYSGARISTPSPLYQQRFLFRLCMILSLTLQK